MHGIIVFAHDFDLWKLHAKFKEQAADCILGMILRRV